MCNHKISPVQKKGENMAAVLTPAIARVLDIGERVISGEKKDQELLNALDDAEKFQKESEALFGLLFSSVLRDEESTSLLGYLDRNLVEQGESLLRARSSVESRNHLDLPASLHDLERAAIHLSEGLRELREREKAQMPYSSFPILNSLIRVGINVANGSLNPAELRKWLPAAAGLVREMRRDIESFMTLHPDEKRIYEAADKLVADLEDGIGAVLKYLEKGRSEALIDGLRLLRFPSQNLMVALQGMDAIARQRLEFSKLPAVEEFYRAYTGWQHGRCTWEVVARSVEPLRILRRFYRDEVDALRDFPLFFTIRERWQKAEQSVIRLENFFERFEAQLRAGPQPLPLAQIKANLEDASKVVEEALAALEEEIRRVYVAPHFEELKELVGRLLSESITRSYFRERLDFFLKTHENVSSEIRLAFERGGPEELKEVIRLLSKQGKGLREMACFFKDEKTEHLKNGLSQVEEVLPNLVRIQERLREGLRAAQGEPSRMIRCVRCGTENIPGEKHCSRCGALLPASLLEEEAPVTIAGGELGEGKVSRLEYLVARFERGEITPLHLEKELSAYIHRLDAVRRDFESRFLPALTMRQDAGLKKVASDFQENFDELREAVNTMLLGLREDNSQYLFRGLEVAGSASVELREIRTRIRDYLRGR